MKYYYLESEEVNLYPIESIFSKEEITDELLLDLDISQFLYIGDFEQWEDAVTHIVKYGYLSLKKMEENIMSKKYKTKNNLQKAWTNLDLAYEHLEKAFEMLENMSELPCDLEKAMELFDITTISSIKAEVEEMIEEVE